MACYDHMKRVVENTTTAFVFYNLRPNRPAQFKTIARIIKERDFKKMPSRFSLR